MPDNRMVHGGTRSDACGNPHLDRITGNAALSCLRNRCPFGEVICDGFLVLYEYPIMLLQFWHLLQGAFGTMRMPQLGQGDVSPAVAGRSLGSTGQALAPWSAGLPTNGEPPSFSFNSVASFR